MIMAETITAETMDKDVQALYTHFQKVTKKYNINAAAILRLFDAIAEKEEVLKNLDKNADAGT